MKCALLVLLCSSALGLHATPQEEARRIVRESVAWRLNEPNTPQKRKRWNQEIMPALAALENDARLSAYCELLAEKMDDPAVADYIISKFLDEDGLNVASAGNAEALELTRKTLEAYEGKQLPREWIAHQYLSLKGDGRDLDMIIRKDAPIAYYGCLPQRVAGTNIICRHLVSGAFSVLPSVTNTGPQGAYVEAILRQYWERLEGVSGTKDFRPHFNDISKIPAELLTMVVWFDEDGNPVCNVDLGKHGLSMPNLNEPAQGRTFADRLWWGVGCVLCVLAVLLAKARHRVWDAARALRNPLFCVLRCAVILGVAWVCCWLSGMMWSWRVNEEMETVGPYDYSGIPIWFTKTAVHGGVGGGDYIPVREYLNTGVWFIFWLFVRGLLTGRIVGSIPASLIPVRRRIVFGWLMGVLFCGLFFLSALSFFYQKWLYWCARVVFPALIVVALKWLGTGCVFAKRTDGNSIPRNRWIKFAVGIVFIILISICLNKTLPAEGIQYVTSIWFYLVFFMRILIF